MPVVEYHFCDTVIYHIYLQQNWGNPNGNGSPLQYSYLENSIDRGAWSATVHGIIKSQTRLYPLMWELGRSYYHPHFKEEEIEIQSR